VRACVRACVHACVRALRCALLAQLASVVSHRWRARAHHSRGLLLRGAADARAQDPHDDTVCPDLRRARVLYPPFGTFVRENPSLELYCSALRTRRAVSCAKERRVVRTIAHEAKCALRCARTVELRQTMCDDSRQRANDNVRRQQTTCDRYGGNNPVPAVLQSERRSSGSPRAGCA
jgi:hypothetical protein